MRYAQIRDMDISNGDGIGVSLFVQGCHFHCDGCFNKETWDFNGGHEFGDAEYHKIMDLLKRPYISRISILGGEPLSDENVSEVFSLIEDIKCNFDDLSIWLYTGYNFEDIMSHDLIKSPQEDSAKYFRKMAALYCDVIVDGRYDKTCPANYMNPWIGSTNQRVINVNKSIKNGKIIEY